MTDMLTSNIELQRQDREKHIENATISDFNEFMRQDKQMAVKIVQLTQQLEEWTEIKEKKETQIHVNSHHRTDRDKLFMYFSYRNELPLAECFKIQRE